MKKLLALFLSLSFTVCACACESTATVNKNETTTAQEKAAQESKEFKIGEEIFITSDDGEYKFMITKVEETAERNQFLDKIPNRVIVVSYSYENISRVSELFLSEMNFKAYDKENNAMDTYPATLEFPDSIPAGRKSAGQMAFGLDAKENYVELEFYDNMFLSSDCKIILEW